MKTCFLILLAAIIFTSCDTPRYAYSPTAHNVPLLTKKGDSKVAAAYSTNGVSSNTDNTGNEYTKNTSQGFDVQGAVALTNNIAIQGSYYYRGEKTNTTWSNGFFNSSSIRYRRNMAEVGAGFYTALDSKQRIFLQAFAGGGLGKTTIKDNGIDQADLPYSRYYNTDLAKFYLEPSITFRAKEIFAGSIATRLSVIKFRNINSNYSLNEKQQFNLDSLNRYALVFFEPAFVGSFGFNKLPGFRIEIQAGLSLLLDDSFIDYRPFNFSAGLVIDIRKLIKGPNN